MTQTINKLPEMVQSFDYFVDRQYYKITSGFIFSSKHLLRSDRIKSWIQWDIVCSQMPDKILINGEEFKLTK